MAAADPTPYKEFTLELNKDQVKKLEKTFALVRQQHGQHLTNSECLGVVIDQVYPGLTGDHR